MCTILEFELEVGTSLVARDWLRVVGILARATSCISGVDNQKSIKTGLILTTWTGILSNIGQRRQGGFRQGGHTTLCVGIWGDC